MGRRIETHCDNCGTDEGVMLRDHGEWMCEHCATVFEDLRAAYAEGCPPPSDRLADERSARAAPNSTSGDQTNG